MSRRQSIILATLMIVGGTPCLTAQPVCSCIEPVSEAPFVFIKPLAVECGPGGLAGSKPAWPRTWNLTPDVNLRLRGRIDTDAIWSSQSPENQAAFGDLEDVVGLRRARVGLEGELGIDRRYVVEIDLVSETVVPRDVYVAFGNRKEVSEAQVGHFREPFSLEGGTSANYFAFVERSPVNTLDPARNWGLGWFRENTDQNTSFALGLFHAGTDGADFAGGPGSSVGLTERLTIAPINEHGGERLLHFGMAFSERVPEDGIIIIKQQPLSSVLELDDSSTSVFVPKIDISTGFQQLINFQVATTNGPLWSQAEWYGSLIDQSDGESIFYRGCHVDCGYFITGEHRRYQGASGTMGPARVNRPLFLGPGESGRKRGWGAWELTARLAYLDFVDPDAPTGSTGQQPGIRLPQSTLGVNWYLSDHVRTMFNYSYATPDDVNTGSSSASIFATRLGVFW